MRSNFITYKVARLFREAPDRYAPLRRHPITGGAWVNKLDRISEQIKIAERALMARAHFARMAPPGAPLLPLSYEDREALKCKNGLDYLISVYARSLAARGFELQHHPSFETYSRAVLASDMAPAFLRTDQALRRRYPPRASSELGPGLIWKKRPARPKITRRARRISVPNCPKFLEAKSLLTAETRRDGFHQHGGMSVVYRDASGNEEANARAGRPLAKAPRAASRPRLERRDRAH